MEDPGPFFSQPHSLPFHHLEMSFSKDAFRKAIVAFRQRFLNETTFYIPPSQSRDGYRKPTPGSTPEAHVPSRYPEDVYFTRMYNYDERFRTPFPGESIEDTKLYAKGYFQVPRHIPRPEWETDPKQIEKVLKTWRESGNVPVGTIRRSLRHGDECLWVSDYADVGMFPPYEYPYNP